jgi:hypothetical protein
MLILLCLYMEEAHVRKIKRNSRPIKGDFQ